MERSDAALARARAAYQRSHLAAAARGVGIAIVLSMLAVELHRTTHATALVALALATVLAASGWRGGGWRRGALAGVLAGVPVFVAPVLLRVLVEGLHAPPCELGPSFACLATCFGTSAIAGIAVGGVAMRDPSPRRFGLAAMGAAGLTGLLGCASAGFGGTIGIVIGLAAGGVTGWIVVTDRPRRA